MNTRTTVPSPTSFVPQAAPGQGLLALPVLLAAVAYLAILSWTMWNGSYDIWGGLIVAPLLLAATIPLATRGARREGDLHMVRLLQLAVVAKVLAGTLARYAIVFGVYGSGDAQGFHGAGQIIANSFRSGDFSVDLGGGGEGTEALNLITGIVYTFIGPTKLGGFFVFSWLAFIGLFLFYRAYRIAIPEGDHRRYALLLFFLPTLVFWPSSIGKESWMMFTLGISAYGAARIFTQRLGGFAVVGVGLVGTAVIRPHLSLLVFVGLSIGYVLRRPVRAGGRLPSGKLLGIAVLAVAGVLLVGRFQSYFHIDQFESGGVQELLDQTAEKSAGGGGSDFEAINATKNPLQFPLAVVTVLFRPFPFEANSAPALVASLEGALIAGLFLLWWRRVLAAARQLVRSSFVAMSAIFTLLYVIAFSTIGNFGLLARQRSLVYPFLIVLLTIPAAAGAHRRAAAAQRWVRQGEATGAADQPPIRSLARTRWP